MAAASKYPDKLLRCLGQVETIVAQLYSGIMDQIARFFILLSVAPEGGGTDNDNNWSTMNTPIHKMMGAIDSSGGWWLLTVALAHGGKAAVVKMVSGGIGNG